MCHFSKIANNENHCTLVVIHVEIVAWVITEESRPKDPSSEDQGVKEKGVKEVGVKEEGWRSGGERGGGEDQGEKVEGGWKARCKSVRGDKSGRPVK